MTNSQGRPDTRPVLLFIYWPIVLVCLVGPVALLWVLLAGATLSDGVGLPFILIGVIGLAGLVAIPFLVRATRSQFRGRGFTGFWQAFRSTNWGPGI